jgi:cell division transport system permease protein
MMPAAPGYVLRETGVNLKRNFIMTAAAILTMAVSLSALAGALIWKQAVNKQDIQWQGGVQISLFLNPAVSNSEVAALRQQLSSNPEVKKFHFVSKKQAYGEAKTMFAANKYLLDALDVKAMPPQFRLVPTQAVDVTQIGTEYGKVAGVEYVIYAKTVIDSLLHSFHILQRIAVVLAVGVMIGAITLIVNTIQLAIFARRREVAVMKLVGATNWFIRIPYMLEGLVHGVVGAAIAFVVSYEFRDSIASFVSNTTAFSGAKLYITPQDAIHTGLIILVVGAGVGLFGSFFAVRRFLSV